MTLYFCSKYTSVAYQYSVWSGGWSVTTYWCSIQEFTCADSERHICQSTQNM